MRRIRDRPRAASDLIEGAGPLRISGLSVPCAMGVYRATLTWVMPVRLDQLSASGTRHDRLRPDRWLFRWRRPCEPGSNVVGPQGEATVHDQDGAGDERRLVRADGLRLAVPLEEVPMDTTGTNYGVRKLMVTR
ncbi:hypothetical protein [Nonomuraea insulae]|uniref:Uncharacterized protein n=1 Tax=Nonomuraea insulae TaxID=1616787 RepID=A0ABW1D0Z7_9ACTN